MIQQPTNRRTPRDRHLSQLSKIELREVSVVREGRPILDQVNLTFERGKRYLIVGENGSGKSTLLKVINRNVCADSSLILMDGIPAEQIDNNDFSRNILMDYQEPISVYCAGTGQHHPLSIVSAGNDSADRRNLENIFLYQHAQRKPGCIICREEKSKGLRWRAPY